MAATQTLQMSFVNQAGTRTTISLDNPKDAHGAREPTLQDPDPGEAGWLTASIGVSNGTEPAIPA
jgi:hypothetical protein